MLIRSQDRELIINFSNMSIFYLVCVESEKYMVVAEGSHGIVHTIGNYSTRKKAINVLNMIQEAYVQSEIARNSIQKRRQFFTDSDLANITMDGMIFCVPEDEDV